MLLLEGFVDCTTQIRGEIFDCFASIGCAFALGQHLFVSDAKGREMSHIMMSVNFLKRAIFVSEMTSLAVGAELFAVELSTILRLILIISTNLLLAQMIVLIVLA